eukprot:symbB.v1.2.035989.t1/scaffold4976.1/size32190/2
MMTPLPNPHMPDGQLPEAREPDLLRLKCSILAMIFFAFGRAVCAIALGAGAGSFDFSALPNMFLNIVMGTFLLKDDQHLRGFYKCLSETIGQAFAVYFACCIYKRIRVPPGEMEMGGFGSGGYNYDPVNRGDAPAQQGFHDARAENTTTRSDSLEDISLGSPCEVPESRDADVDVVEAEDALPRVSNDHMVDIVTVKE